MTSNVKLSLVPFCLVTALALSLIASISFVGLSSTSTAQEKKHVVLTAMLDDQGDPPRLLNMLFQPALQELRARHPELDIQLDYKPIPYLNLHTQFLKTIANQTPVDILALEVQPANMESYLKLYGKDFKKRYQIYENEIMKLKF